MESIGEELMEGLGQINDPRVKVEIVFQWIQRLILEGMKDGMIPTPAPIVSRTFQELNAGMLALYQMSAITDTPFPFPYVQMITVLLLIHVVITPFILAVQPTQWFLAGCFAFISVFAL